MTRPRTEGFYARAGKRAVDLAIAAPLFALLLAPMAILGAAAFVTSGMPVLFTQERVGRFGRRFRIAKFRTMIPGSERAGFVTIAGDPRVTPIGRILRKWKLDELPQLWNVLRGDMSLVGPRADVPELMEGLQGEDRRILSVRPGITGPATLRYRHEEALLARQPDPLRYNAEVIFPDKVRINRIYVENLSLREDLRAIADTLFALIRTDSSGGTLAERLS